MLVPDADTRWDDDLRAIDVALVEQATCWCRLLSAVQGRLGTPVTVVLRMLILKHLYDWSFDECEREARGSLVYRPLCRIGCKRVPDAKTRIRLAKVLGPEVLQGMVERLVVTARRRKIIRGFRMRVDTTVVETNIHYPTDSTVLADVVRVLTRPLKQLHQVVEAGVLRLPDRARRVARRLFRIVQLGRQVGRQSAKARLPKCCRQLMGLTLAVVRQAGTAGHQIAKGAVQGNAFAQARVEELGQRHRDTVGLVWRLLAQTRARVLKGDTH